jgi:predicted phage terminase large subunit-like protein
VAWTRRQLSLVCTVDLATSLSESVDFTCFEAWGIMPDGDYLLLDVLRERLPGERHLPALTSFCAKWRPTRVYVESVGSQLAFVQQAQAQGLPVEPPRRDRGQHKGLRVIPLIQAFADGRVYLDALAGWLDAFARELLAFPNSGYDDQVDCASDAVMVLASGV